MSGCTGAARSTRGFALLAVVVVLGLLGVLAVVAHHLSQDRLRLAWAVREAGAALYAAEAGLETALARWDPELAETLAPGQTVALAAGGLRNGDRFTVEVTRLDDGSRPGGYYVIESVGRARGAWRGRRALARVVGTRVPPASCCAAGSEAGGGVEDTVGGASVTPTSEIHLPHPLAQFGWLKILE